MARKSLVPWPKSHSVNWVGHRRTLKNSTPYLSLKLARCAIANRSFAKLFERKLRDHSYL